MQIETSVRYHYMHFRMTKMRENIGTTIAGRDSEQRNSHLLVVGVQIGTCTLEDSFFTKLK